MLTQMVTRSLIRNAKVSAWTLATLAICAVLVTLFTSTCAEVGQKMRTALRRMGANTVAYPAGGHTPTDWPAFERIAQQQAARVVLLCARVGMVEGKAIAVVAAEPEGLRCMTPYWAVSGQLPLAGGECLVGRRAADALQIKVGKPVTVAWTTGRAKVSYRVVGIADTRDEDDDRIFVPQFADGEGFNYALVSVPGGEQEIARLQNALTAQQVAVEVKPLRQVIQGERHVLDKIRVLSATTLGAVLILTALGVSASMLARVVERRKECALL